MSEGIETAILRARTADEMQRLGEVLGRLLLPGDVVGLVGPLGAGKTTFAQGLARGLEVPRHRHVASPTFALVNEHPGRVPFVHADLYRIRDAVELNELGLADAFDRAATAIEWLDRFRSAAPDDHLEIRFDPEPDGARRLVLTGTGPRGEELAAQVANAAMTGGG